jgi:hypothetical protein
MYKERDRERGFVSFLKCRGNRTEADGADLASRQGRPGSEWQQRGHPWPCAHSSRGIACLGAAHSGVTMSTRGHGGCCGRRWRYRGSGGWRWHWERAVVVEHYQHKGRPVMRFPCLMTTEASRPRTQ